MEISTDPGDPASIGWRLASVEKSPDVNFFIPEVEDDTMMILMKMM